MNSKEYLVMGDLAGRFDEMILVLKEATTKYPEAKIILVGDITDRGPKSRQCIEYLIEHPEILVLDSNHGHLMWNAYENTDFYDKGLWVGYNGGLETMFSYPGAELYFRENAGVSQAHFNSSRNSYGPPEDKDQYILTSWIKKFVPEHHIDWLKSRDPYFEDENIIVTHAPINPVLPFEELISHGTGGWCSITMNSIYWNRNSTRRRKDGKFQIHGHMALRKATELKDKQGIYGFNCDSSKGDKLSIVHWPSKEVFEQPYLE